MIFPQSSSPALPSLDDFKVGPSSLERAQSDL
jgi:hypothetical protein